MPEPISPLDDELNSLCTELLKSEDQAVINVAAEIARTYRHRIDMLYALDGVDRMIQEDILAIERRLVERLQKAKETVRDELKALVSGTLPPHDS